MNLFNKTIKLFIIIKNNYNFKINIFMKII